MLISPDHNLGERLAKIDHYCAHEFIQQYESAIADAASSLTHSVIDSSLITTLVFTQYMKRGIESDALRESANPLLNICTPQIVFENIRASLQSKAYVLLPKTILPRNSDGKEIRGDMAELLSEEGMTTFQMEFVCGACSKLCEVLDRLLEITVQDSGPVRMSAPVILIWRMDEIFACLQAAEDVIETEVGTSLTRILNCCHQRVYLILPDEDVACYHIKRKGIFNENPDRRVQASDILNRVIRLAKEMLITVDATDVLWKCLAPHRTDKGGVQYVYSDKAFATLIMVRCIRAKGLLAVTLILTAMNMKRRIGRKLNKNPYKGENPTNGTRKPATKQVHKGKDGKAHKSARTHGNTCKGTYSRELLTVSPGQPGRTSGAEGLCHRLPKPEANHRAINAPNAYPPQ